MSRHAMLVAGIFAFAAAGAPAKCPLSTLTRGVNKPKTITLNAAERGVRDAPAFYLHGAEFVPVMFFKPEDVVERLKKNIVELRENPTVVGAAWEKYLEQVRRDLPLREDTDLFKYSLRAPTFAANMSELVGALLESGQVILDDWPYHNTGVEDENDRDESKVIIMQTRGKYLEESRWFCNERGQELFSNGYTMTD